MFQQVNFNNNSQPHYVLVTPEGKVINTPVSGYMPKEDFKILRMWNQFYKNRNKIIISWIKKTKILKAFFISKLFRTFYFANSSFTVLVLIPLVTFFLFRYILESLSLVRFCFLFYKNNYRWFSFEFIQSTFYFIKRNIHGSFYASFCKFL